MKKNILFIFLTILGLSASSQNPEVTIETVTGALPGNSYPVGITLNNFSPNSISSFQFTVRYDTNYLKYNYTTDWATGVSGVTIQVVNLGNINAIRFEWVGTPVVISSLLCKLNFIYKTGSSCNPVNWSDDPLPRNFKDSSNADYTPVDYVDGSVCLCNAVSIGGQINPQNLSICADYESGIFTAPKLWGDAPFTYQWQYNNSGTWINVVNSTPTGAIYTNANAQSMTIGDISAVGSYQYRCYVTNCSGTNYAVTNIATLEVKARPSAPQVGTITPPTCSVATGSVVLNGLPSGNWIVTRNPGNYNTPGSTTSTTLSGIFSGTYSFTVTDQISSCTSVPSAPVAIPTPPVVPATLTVGTITQPTCTDSTGHVTVSNLPSSGTWTLTSNPPAISITGTGTSVTVNGLPAGQTYTFTVNNGYCSSVASATVTINPKPVTPTPPIVGSITQPTCAVPTGSVVLNGLPSSGNWTLNPGGIVSSGGNTTISGLAQGTYNYTVTNASTCTSVASANIVINPPPLPPDTATTTVTQPTCAVGTGTITVTAPLGAYEYNIDGGPYQGSAIFSGIGAGLLHIIRVRSTTDNTCISSNASVTVHTAPLPPNQATVNITQPTCAVATGTIVVTFPLGLFQYSIDGVTWQSSLNFTGVAPGPYSVLVRSATDNTCVSYPTAVTINAPPTPPIAPTANITIQPTCANPTAIIEVTSPIGAYEYKLDNNAFQVSPTFIGVAVGTHNIVVRSTTDNTCVSIVTTITVNAPLVPAAATASTTIQPTCAVGTGTVVVTAPTGSYEYNIGGGAWQGATTFAGVAPGQHNILVRSYTDGTCISSATTVFVNAQPSPPSAATTSVTQPTCAVVTGTIVVTAPIGAYEYNIDGVAYQSSSSFTGVGSGSHIILVRSTADNTCVSSNAIVNISAQPSTPIAATASVTVEPTCASPTGTIMVTAPIGAYEYSIDGGATWQVSTTFSGVAPGTHSILVRRITDTTCVSTSATLVTLNTPTAPAAATASTTIQPTCDIATGTVVVTSPLGAYEYNIDGGVWQASTTFTGVVPGVHTVLVRRTTDNSCVSTGTNVTVNPQPVSPDNIPDQFDTIYSGQSFLVTPSPVPAGTVYTWSAPVYTSGVYGGAAGSGSSIYGTLSIPSDTGTAIYTVIPTTGSCVGDTFTVTVTVISVMHFIGGITVDNDSVCLGDSIHLNVNVTGGNPPYTYTWTGSGLSSTFVKNPLALPDLEGENIYIVSVTDGSAILSDTISIFVNSLPSLTLNYNCASYTSTALPENLSSYEFLLNGTLTQPASATNTYFSASVVNRDSITVIATDQNGCKSSATIGINCLRGAFPTAFTPDGDGFNDKYPTDDYPLINYELTIFDRWGLTLYTGESGWDGTYKGKLMPPATYYYRLIRTEPDGSKTEEVGSVTLVKN